MVQLKPNEPVETAEAVIEVEVSEEFPLPVGQHIFELIVVDDAGNASEPARKEVIVRDSTRPTAVLDAPREVEAGQPFRLNGERSSDVPPGKVVTYIWTLIERA